MKPSGEHFISGIYNYCDRWCERCIYTDRCRVFAMEKAFTEAYEAEQRYKKSREENKKFWEQIDLAMAEASEIFDDLIPRQKEVLSPETGFFPEFDDTEEDDFDGLDDDEKYHEKALQHPLSKTAERYGQIANNWFKERKGRLREVYDAESKTLTIQYPGISDPVIIKQLSEAAEVIRWYEFQIDVKIKRALASRFEEQAHPEIYEGLPKDSAGSAMVALKGIERSLGGWNRFYQHIPAERTTIAPLMTLLFLLRAQLLKQLPGAATFRWPPGNQN